MTAPKKLGLTGVKLVSCGRLYFEYIEHMEPEFTTEEDVMANFTPTQARYLAFVHAYTKLYGYPPAESEIAGAIRVSAPSVNQMVKVLEKKGLIRREPGQPRSIQVMVPEDKIPSWDCRK
jgi:DNA-binding MarR family transcriptional regulator